MNTTIHLGPSSQAGIAPRPGAPLVAENAAAAAASAVSRLVNTLEAGSRPAPATPALRPNGPSVDQVLGALLRPLVKDWLDRELPELTDRMVRTEVRRIVSGGI